MMIGACADGEEGSMLGEDYGSEVLEGQGRLPPRRGIRCAILRPPALADGRSHCGALLAGRSAEGDPAQEAWGAESARTPAAIMLEKVNLHLEALRMPTANHDVEVHLARQAIRALSEAVSRDAGETIAAMKLHRRVRGTAAPRRLLAPPSVSPALTLRVGCRSPRTRSRCCESATCCWSGT